MASQTPARQLGRALKCSASLRTAYAPRACSILRLYSSTSSADDAAPSPPPLLQKLKGDLKAAMRAKDAPRLSVLRSIMSANLNASKTDKPIRTDLDLVGLIRKMERNAAQVIQEARAAKREDLVEKEQLQADILKEYADGSGVKTIAGDDLKAVIQAAVEASKSEGSTDKIQMKDVIRRVKDATEGQDVDNKELAILAKAAMQ